jgi:hypothetical protein
METKTSQMKKSDRLKLGSVQKLAVKLKSGSLQHRSRRKYIHNRDYLFV